MEFSGQRLNSDTTGSLAPGRCLWWLDRLFWEQSQETGNPGDHLWIIIVGGKEPFADNFIRGLDQNMKIFRLDRHRSRQRLKLPLIRPMEPHELSRFNDCETAASDNFFESYAHLLHLLPIVKDEPRPQPARLLRQQET